MVRIFYGLKRKLYLANKRGKPRAPLTIGDLGEDMEERAIEKLKTIHDMVPLMRMKLKGREQVVAYAEILWHEKKERLVYNLHEPGLSAEETDALSQLKKESDYSSALSALRSKRFRFDEGQQLKLQYHLFKHLAGLGRIEPLMHDKNISEIILSRPVYVKHREPLYDWIETDVIIPEDELDSIHSRLKNNDSMRFWFDRALRIRKFRAEPMSIIDLVKEGVLSIDMLAYLWLCMENGMSVFIAGPAETGKTTVLNAMPGLLHPKKVISSAESEPELRLRRDEWHPLVDASLFDAVRNALKQKSDYTFVNDIEAEETYLLFTAMASGMPLIATMAADNMNALLDSVSAIVPKPMLEHLDIVIFMALRKKRGEYIRRVVEVNEVIGYNRHSGQIITNRVFQWNASRDDFEVLRSVLLYKLGFDEEGLKSNIEKKVKLLADAVKKNADDVSKALFR